MAGARVSKAWLPNVITVARLPLAGVTVACVLEEEFAAAFWLLILAGVTDALDGLTARWLNARTPLGSYLDPIADKVLLVGVFLALGWTGLLPVWLVVLVVARDVLILAAAGILYTLERTIRMLTPSAISKLNTLLQIVLAAAALAIHGFGLPPDPTITMLVVCVAITTLGSGAGYAVQLLKRARALCRHRVKDAAVQDRAGQDEAGDI